MIQDSTSKIVPFGLRFKNKLFYLFHSLLLFKDIGPNLGTALLLLQLIQSLVLTFNGKNPYLYAYFFGYIIGDIDVIQLYPVVDRYFAASARIVMNLFLLAFVLGISISLIILANKKDYLQNVGIQHIAYLLGYFYEFTTKLLFVPIFGTFILTLKCGDKDVTCFAGSHIILLVTSIIGIILLLIVSYIIDAFFFDFSFKSKDSLAHAPVSDFVLGFIYKTVAVILTVGVFDLEYSSLVALYHIVFNSFFLFNSIKKVTYFDLKVHVMNLIASATLMWTNASLVAVDLIDFQLLRNNTIFIIIAGSIFFVMLCRNVRQQTQDNLVTKEAGELESDILLDSKVRFFFKLARSSRNDSQSDLLFASLIKIHIDHCADMNCPCKNREGLYDPKRNTFTETKSNPHQDQTFIKHFIYYMLKSGSLKFFNSELVFLDTIFFLFEAMRNYPQAYHLIHVYEKKNMSNNPRIVMQFIIYRLYAKMQDYSHNRNQRITTAVLPYEKVMEYDEEMKTLKTMVYSQIEHYINVWEMIDSEFPDLNILNKLLEKTFNYKEKVIKQYEKTVRINDQSLDMKTLMSVYASYVAYDDELGLRVEREIKPRVAMDNHSDNFNLDRDMEAWNIFDPNCYTIEIANQMDKLGQIINFSKNATDLLGYKDQALRYQNVKILIPRVIAWQHDRILEDFFKNGQDSGLRHAIHNFSINSKGHCFSCHIIIKAIPMHGHYRLMALFRKMNQYDYLITDDKGTIDAFGEKVGNMFELTPQTIEKMRLNFALIAPKVIKYFHYYLIKKEKTLGETSVTKIRSFYVFIPSNWKSFLQKWQEKRRPKSMVSVPSLNLGGQEPEDFEDIDEYYHNMLEFMMKDKQPSYKKIYKVKAIVEHMELRNKKIQMKSFKIISYKEKSVQAVAPEKIKKQQAFIPILAKKISKILEQRKRIAHQIELDKHKAQENEEAEQAAEGDELEAGKEGYKKEQKEAKKPKGIWGNLLDKAKKRGSKKSEKSLDALLRGDSENSERGLNDGRDDESLDGISSDVNTPRGDSKESKIGSQIVRVDTDRALVKKPSILKKKSTIRDQDHSFDKNNSVIERFKKKVKIFQEKKKKEVDVTGDTSPISNKKKKDKKVEKPLVYASLLTEESSSYDGFDVAEIGDLQSVDSKAYKEKHPHKDLLQIEKAKKEGQEQIEKKHIGPSSVASSSSYQVKDFSIRLKALLRGKYVPTSLRMTNKMEVVLTLLVLALINIISASIRNQVGDWVDSIQTVNTPNLYEVYLYKTMDSYLTLSLLSTGALNSTIYDNTWFNMDRAERETMYNDIRLLRKTQLENAAFTKDLYSLYFSSEKYAILTKGVTESRTGNFSEFLGRFMNSLQMTLDYQLIQFSSSNDEFLYVLNYNFFATQDFLTQQKSSLIGTIGDALSTIKSLITAEQISGTVIIVFSLAIILPMFLMHNLHLEEILVLFTNVSKRDSDFFLRHYRDMRGIWGTDADDPHELQKRVVDNVKVREEERKRSKLSTNSKSRPFKRLKRNYKKHIVIISSSILVFTALVTVKAALARNELSDIQQYLSNFESLSEEGSNVFKVLHNYKLMLSTVLNGDMPTQQQLDDYSKRLLELEQYSETTLSVDDQQSIGISQANIDYLKLISVNNTCAFVESEVRNECESLFGGTLKKGFLVVRSPLHSFATDYFLRFIQIKNAGNTTDLISKSQTFLNDQDLKDYLRAWTFVQQVIFGWLESSYGDMQVKKVDMMSVFNLLLAFTSISLFMNLLTWRYSYHQLVQTLLKFHRYFEILPLDLIQNNRSMRFYFERYFRLKERR